MSAAHSSTAVQIENPEPAANDEDDEDDDENEDAASSGTDATAAAPVAAPAVKPSKKRKTSFRDERFFIAALPPQHAQQEADDRA